MGRASLCIYLFTVAVAAVGSSISSNSSRNNKDENSNITIIILVVMIVHHLCHQHHLQVPSILSLFPDFFSLALGRLAVQHIANYASAEPPKKMTFLDGQYLAVLPGGMWKRRGNNICLLSGIREALCAARVALA